MLDPWMQSEQIKIAQICSSRSDFVDRLLFGQVVQFND